MSQERCTRHKLQAFDLRMFFNLYSIMNTFAILINSIILLAGLLLISALGYEFSRAVRGTCQFARNIRTQAILSPAPSPIAALPASPEPLIELTLEASLESAREDAIGLVRATDSEPTPDSEPVLDSKLTPNAIEEPTQAPAEEPVETLAEEPVEALAEDSTPELDSFPPIASISGSTDDLDIPNFSEMSVRQLREYAKANQVKGYSKHKSKAALAHFLEMNFIARANRERTEALRDTLTPGSPEWQAIDNILATL